MGSATPSVEKVRKGVPEETACKLRRTWAEGKRIFRAEGTIAKSLEP